MEKKYPELKTRIQSTFIDLILMIVLSFVSAWVLDRLSNQEESDDGWLRAIIFIGIWGVYEPLSTTLGATLGNYLMKIRVRKEHAHEKRINIFQAFIRFIFKLMLGWVSFLTIHFNEQRRAIHDIMAGSVMLEK